MIKYLIILSLLWGNCISYLSIAQIKTVISLGCEVHVIDERELKYGRLIRVRFTCPEKCCSCEESE